MKIKDLIYRIDDVSFYGAVDFVVKNAKKSEEKNFVITINTEIVMYAKRDPDYEKVLRFADLLVNDSVGVKWARGMFGKSSKERIHGVDLFEAVVEKAAEEKISIGLLGAGEGIAEKTAQVLKQKYPGLKIAFSFMERSKGNDLNCDILFVAFGSPKQEKWIYENFRSLDANVAIGVGGSFDFISGEVRRAPEWIQRIGLEWLFRLIIQPWRIKRQVSLVRFVLLVIKERIGIYE